MKKITFLLIINVLSIVVFAQTKEQAMEKRAREFHRMITLSDKEQWKKFVTENYTKTFIERPMNAKVQRQDNEGTSQNVDTIKGTVEDKARMFDRLHNDFGSSKINSLKVNGDQVDMVVDGSNLNGNFRLKFNTEKPYLIDGLGIEVRGGEN